MPYFDAAGIAVYALSYDEPDALQDFRDARNITFTLLSDAVSIASTKTRSFQDGLSVHMSARAAWPLASLGRRRLAAWRG